MRHDETVSYSLSNSRLQLGDWDHALELFDCDNSLLVGKIKVKIQWYSKWIKEKPATLEEPAEAGYYEWSDLCILSAKFFAIAAPNGAVGRPKYKFPLNMIADFSPAENADLWEFLRHHIECLIDELPQSYYEEAYENES